MKKLIVMLVIILGWTVVAAAEEIPQEIIPAIYLKDSAKIDGDLSDPVWQKAFYDSPRVFIDDQMRKPLFTEEPTETWVYYNNEGIFLAFKCIDQYITYQYTQIKNTPEIGRGADDGVGFNLMVDTEKHYDADSQYWFIINPGSAFYFRPAVGRAAKAEYTGDCIGKTRVYEGYWTAEILLKWEAVDYPVKDKPYDMLLLPQRWQKHPSMAARLSHYPKTFAGTDTRLNFCRFKGVKPPQKGIETKISPNTFAGWSEDRAWEKHLGLDLRVRPTSETNIFVTVNPDFKNIEQYIARIDPEYGPARLREYRYFFQEGSKILKLPDNFYSPKIQEIDVGLSGYGKLYDISLVSLATLYRGGDNNLVLRGYKDWKSNHLGGAYIGHRKTENSVFWLDAGRTTKWYELLGDVGQSLIGTEDSGRKYWGMVKVKGKNLLSSNLSFTWMDSEYLDDIGFFPVVGIYGSNFSVTKQKVWAAGKRFIEARTEIEIKNFVDGEIHRRTIFAYIWHRRGLNGVYADLTVGKFGQFENDEYKEYTDALLCLMPIALNYGNTEKFARVVYTVGRRQDKSLHQIDTSFGYRFGKLRPKLSNQLVWHGGEFRYQTILNLNYELTKTFGLGSRTVVSNDGFNSYLVFHRTGFKGPELFLILGDPNAKKVQKRIIAKMIYAF